MTAAKMTPRILKEIKAGIMSDLFDFFLDEEGLYGDKNNAFIKFLVQNGIYIGETHILRIKFTYGSNQPYIFPKDPPNVVFETPIFHTNIATGGAICLDVIKPDKWSAMYGIEQIFMSIIALLDAPNTNSPFHHEASKKYVQYKNDLASYSNICHAYYNEKLEQAKKILQAPEFMTAKVDKMSIYGVPRNQWPADLLASLEKK